MLKPSPLARQPSLLASEIAGYLAAAPGAGTSPPKAIIAPHAGYVYSGPIAASIYARLAPLGRLVVYGFHSMLPRRGGRPDWLKLAWDWLRTPRFNPLRLTTENRSVLAFNLSFLGARADRMIPAMDAVLAGIVAGRLQPVPVTTYPFDEVARAHCDLESGQTQGKLVLRV